MGSLREQEEKIEFIAVGELVIARNKLIEDLLEQIPESDKAFRKALSMRSKAWEADAEIWRRARETVENKEVEKCLIKQ